MAKTNIPRKPIYTHEGAKASHINPELQLRRSVMSCLLFEGEFYEDGVSISERVRTLIPKVDPAVVADIAIKARTESNLRHMPLFIIKEMSRLKTYRPYVQSTLINVIKRADELAEFLALYWKEGKVPIANSIKKGLAECFKKFDEYQFAKYNRDGVIKLRDVMFLCHPNPDNKEQELLFKKIAENTLSTPDTWEVSLSKDDGVSKVEKWERLLSENKMGAMALLRNLRNFNDSGVKSVLVKDALINIKAERVLPFRFVSAAKYAPQWEKEIEVGMLRCLSKHEKLGGKTIIIVDVSGSMYGSHISEKSELDRAQAACALTILLREVCEEPVIYATAGNDLKRVHKTQIVPSRHGFALSDVIYNLCRPLGGGGIFLRQVMDYVYDKENEAERIIVITDEQDCDITGSPAKAHTFGNKNYLINVASNAKGIGYGPWVHIDGWSESVINFITELEKVKN